MEGAYSRQRNIGDYASQAKLHQAPGRTASIIMGEYLRGMNPRKLPHFFHIASEAPKAAERQCEKIVIFYLSHSKMKVYTPLERAICGLRDSAAPLGLV